MLNGFTRMPGALVGQLEGVLSWNVPWTTYTYTWLSQTDCMAAGFPQREHFKRKEVEAPGVLSLGPESLLPYSDGQAVRKSSQL